MSFGGLLSIHATKHFSVSVRPSIPPTSAHSGNPEDRDTKILTTITPCFFVSHSNRVRVRVWAELGLGIGIGLGLG